MTKRDERIVRGSREHLRIVYDRAFGAGLVLGTRLGYTNLIGFLALFAYLTWNL